MGERLPRLKQFRTMQVVKQEDKKSKKDPIPQEHEIQICLHCTKAFCRGYCEKVRKMNV